MVLSRGEVHDLHFENPFWQATVTLKDGRLGQEGCDCETGLDLGLC